MLKCGTKSACYWSINQKRSKQISYHKLQKSNSICLLVNIRDIEYVSIPSSLHMVVMKNAMSHAIEQMNIKVQVSFLECLPQNIRECYVREYIFFNTIVLGSHLKNQELFLTYSMSFNSLLVMLGLKKSTAFCGMCTYI